MSDDNPNTKPETTARAQLWFYSFPVLAILSTLVPQIARDYMISQSLVGALSAFSTSATLIFCLSWRPGNQRFALAASILAGSFFAVIAYFAFQRFGLNKEPTSAFVILFLGQLLFVTLCLLPFLQTRLETKRWMWKDERIFTYAWNNGLILSLGTVFAVTFFLAFVVVSNLLELLGNNFIEGAFHKIETMTHVVSAAIGFAITLARLNKRFVSILRNTVTVFASILAPILILSVLFFLFLLIMNSLGHLNGKIDPTSSFVTYAVLGLFVTNALVFNSEEVRNKHRFLRICVIVLQPLLIGMTAFACYAIYIRIAQYGLTPRRLVFSFAMLLVLFHFMSSLLSFLFRTGWVEACRRSRVIVTLAAVAFVFVTLSPIADPFTLSAQSQYRRLADGHAEPETFNYGYLARKLGNAGHQALAQLRVDTGAAAYNAVNRKIDELQRGYPIDSIQNIAFASQESVTQDTLKDSSRIILIPPSLELPSVLLGDFLGPFVSKASCALGDGPGCLVAAVELTDGDGLEYLIAVRKPDAVTEVWMMERHGAQVRQSRLLRPGNRLELWDALVKGDFAAVPANHFDLRVGNEVIHLKDLW